MFLPHNGDTPLRSCARFAGPQGRARRSRGFTSLDRPVNPGPALCCVARLWPLGARLPAGSLGPSLGFLGTPRVLRPCRHTIACVYPPPTRCESMQL